LGIPGMDREQPPCWSAELRHLQVKRECKCILSWILYNNDQQFKHQTEQSRSRSSSV